MARKKTLADYFLGAMIGFPPNGSLPCSDEDWSAYSLFKFKF